MDLLDRLRIDVPVVQAGMGGGVSGASLAGAVAAAGALGTLGLASPAVLRSGILSIRDQARGRAVAVNLLMPFVRKRHIETCLDEHVEVAVLFYGGTPAVVDTLHGAGTFVLVQVGTPQEARDAIGWGADGLIAQGIEAGGHLVGREPSLDFLTAVLPIAKGRPVLVAGGIADSSDTRRALDAGADAVVAGTRFMLTHESGAHRLYQQRVLAATATFETTLFGLGWPARHRIIANAATQRWCRSDGSPRQLPAWINQKSAPLSRVINDRLIAMLPHVQQAMLPLLAPTPPLTGMRDAIVDATPLYAGESALRIDSILSARAAVDMLAG